MQWWEQKKHILVRERYRLNREFRGNNFSFEVRDNALWVTGTLLNFFEFECRYPDSYPSAPPAIYPKDRSSHWVPKHQYVKTGRFCLNIREKTWNSSLSAADIIKSLMYLLIAEDIRKEKGEEKLIFYEEDEPTRLQKKFKSVRCVVPCDVVFPKEKSIGIFKYFCLFKSDTYRVVVKAVDHEGKDVKSSEVAPGIWTVV